MAEVQISHIGKLNFLKVIKFFLAQGKLDYRHGQYSPKQCLRSHSQEGVIIALRGKDFSFYCVRAWPSPDAIDQR